MTAGTTTAGSPTGHPHDLGTRERVLSIVSERGPVSATGVGRILGLTPAAVRRHLDALTGDGSVVERSAAATTARGRGRPARTYVVSDKGHEALAAGYDRLAADAVAFLARAAGPDAVAGFAAERASGLVERYGGAMAAAGDRPDDRAEALAGLLARDGFAATSRPVEADGVTGVQLCQGHCPIQHVAEQFPQFCDAETAAFSQLLGVHVQRLATLAAGHHVCTTFVPTHALAHPSSETPTERSSR